MRLPRARREGRKPFLIASVVTNTILVFFILWSRMPTDPLAARGAPGAIYSSSTLQTLTDELQAFSTSLDLAKARIEEQAQRHERSQRELRDALSKQAALSQENARMSAVLANQTKLLDSRPALQQNTTPDKLWLTIGIPTIPRKRETDYLTRTLESLLEELPLDATDPLYRRVQVIIMNNRPGNHTVFEKVKKRVYADDAGADNFVRKARLYLDFQNSQGAVQDPTPGAKDPDDNNNPTNRPGREVRRQTCDLIELLELAQPLSHYYVFMEDDFRVCPNMMRILSYAVRKLNTIPELSNWLAMRFSYGMNGVLVRNSDLQTLSAYMRKHTARLPPDLLWVEWYTGRKPELRTLTRGRKLAVYRWNLLDHIGARSSFAVRTWRPDWPRCFDPMAHVWSLGKTEQFQEKRCLKSDISPCPPDSSGETWTRYPIEWPKILEGYEEDHPPLPPEERLAQPNVTHPARPVMQRNPVPLKRVVNRRFAENDVALTGLTA